MSRPLICRASISITATIRVAASGSAAQVPQVSFRQVAAFRLRRANSYAENRLVAQPFCPLRQFRVAPLALVAAFYRRAGSSYIEVD